MLISRSSFTAESLVHLRQWNTLDENEVLMLDTSPEMNAAYPDIDVNNVWSRKRWTDVHLPIILKVRMCLKRNLIEWFQAKLKLFVDEITGISVGRPMGEGLRRFIDDALAVPTRKIILESKYGLELATFYTASGDFDRARYYVAQTMESFLSSWTTMHPLHTAGRLEIIQVDYTKHELHILTPVPEIAAVG